MRIGSEMKLYITSLSTITIFSITSKLDIWNLSSSSILDWFRIDSSNGSISYKPHTLRISNDESHALYIIIEFFFIVFFIPWPHQESILLLLFHTEFRDQFQFILVLLLLVDDFFKGSLCHIQCLFLNLGLLNYFLNLVVLMLMYLYSIKLDLHINNILGKAIHLI